MKRVVCIVVVCMFFFSGCSQPVKENGSSEKNEKVNSELSESNEENYQLGELAKEYNLKIGAAIEPSYLLEDDYASVLKDQFSVVTPENRMKWGFIHPDKDTYSFEEADQIVDFAMENDMDVRGHALVWHIENPDWLTSEEWTREELLEILEDHIKTVVGHYKGKVYAWDVVNEALENNHYRETMWYKVIGPEYIEYAIKWAHEADPDAKLFINDYLVEEGGPKADAYYNLIKELLDKDVPIDGAGFQFHIDMEQPLDMTSVYTNLQRFIDLGIDIDFTEIDVRMAGTPDEKMLANQGKIYRDLMEMAIHFDAITSYTLWGFTDKYSWIPGFFGDRGAGLIFDENYNAKKAFYSLGEALTAGKVELPYEAMLDTSDRVWMSPFIAKKADNIPVIDGNVKDGEWDSGVTYNLAYNQLDGIDQRTPKNTLDSWGDFTLLYKDGNLYGKVNRIDNITVTSVKGETYKNDNVEVFVEYDDYFEQLRTVVGTDFEGKSSDDRAAVWNEDGTILEFMIKLPEEDMTGLTMGFNIAMADTDSASAGRKYQLYPITGLNNSYKGKDLGLLFFEGDTPRPVNFEKVIPPINIAETLVFPEINGENGDFEWTESVAYPFSYDLNQDLKKGAPMEKDDIFGSFRIGHSGNSIYGQVERTDDVTIVSDDNLNSDGILFNTNINGVDIEFISSVGKDEKIEKNGIVITTNWSEDGEFFEFLIDLNNINEESKKSIEEGLTAGSIHPFNILLIDADEEVEINHVLSPFNGKFSLDFDIRGEMEIQ
ncbi:endo-1,4-beta-xylanase [Clostridium sp. DL1XJH146]